MNIQKIIEKNKEAIVLIDLQIPKNKKQNKISIRGTGFIISSDGKIITTSQVYQQIPKNELQYIGVYVPIETNGKNITRYERYPVELLKIDDENDIALLKIKSERKFKTVVKFGNSENVKEGEDVVYLGYPLITEMLQMGLGVTMTIHKCIISSIKRSGIDGSLHYFLISTFANTSSNGSPLFNENGEVIGIVVSKISSKIPTPDGKMMDIIANIGICRPLKKLQNLTNL